MPPTRPGSENAAPVRPTVPPWPPEDHVCSDCSLAYQEISLGHAVEVVRAVPAGVRAAVAAVAPRTRRRRPAHGGWSITEYVHHLRDVYVTYTIRVHRARTEDCPALEPMLNDLRARRFRYNERGTTCILSELGATVDGFLQEVERVAPHHLDRRVIRPPSEVRTLRWLLRQAAHEGHHHLRDIEVSSNDEHQR